MINSKNLVNDSFSWLKDVFKDMKIDKATKKHVSYANIPIMVAEIKKLSY